MVLTEQKSVPAREAADADLVEQQRVAPPRASQQQPEAQRVSLREALSSQQVQPTRPAQQVEPQQRAAARQQPSQPAALSQQ